MAVLFGKSGALYGNRRLPAVRQTLVGPGTYLNRDYPPIAGTNPPSVEHQRQLPQQNPEAGPNVQEWPFGELLI